jgi:predicted nucleotidyltransferase
MDQLSIAIEKTREYGRKYGVEYDSGQIKRRLISDRSYTEKEIDSKLNGIKIIGDKLTNKHKIEMAQNIANLIGRYFGDILMIAVTGSVAAGYPKKSDDIDLMLITKKDRLWLIRLMLRLFVLVMKIPHRKYNKKEVGNEFCFNLWLEEDVLELPKNRQNLRNAMDSILMVPILNRDRTYEKFINKNKWIEKFMANAYAQIN